MTCQEFLARYSEFLDELLDPMEAARWHHHLGRCASCARYDRVVRQGLELVRDLPLVEPSPDFEPRLQHRLFHARDEQADERASGASAVVALAIAGMLAAIAWSPLLRQDPLTIDLPAVQARAPGADFGAPGSTAFSLPATWPAEPAITADRALRAEVPSWWWDLPASGLGAGWPISDFVSSSFAPTPGPYSPLMVDRPDYGPARARVRGASASSGTLGRE